MQLTGRLSESDLVSHLARCRAVVFPPFDEDYGFVTVEAFASSRPVITCQDSGGPAEIVEDGVSGLVVEPTPEALAKAFRRIIDDRDGGRTHGHGWRRVRGAPDLARDPLSLAASCKLKSHELSDSARGANRQEDDARDSRLRHGRGWRSRDGRPLGRERQLGPVTDSQRAPRARPIDFSLVAVNVDSGYEGYQHELVAAACQCARLGVPSGQHVDWRNDRYGARCGSDPVLALRTASPRGAVSRRVGAGRDEDRARSPRRRLRRNAASQHVFCRRAESHAGAARVGQPASRCDTAAGVRLGRRSARVCQGVRTAGDRLLLSGLRRPQPAAATDQTAAHGPRARASGYQAVAAEVALERPAASPARSAAELEPVRGRA